MRLRYNKAFSLIEVLITVAILSTAIIFVFRSFTASLNTARFSQDITLASFLAEDKLWNIEKKFIANAALPFSGSEIMQNRTFNWDYKITETQIANLSQFKFTVSWKENVREKQYPIEFFTYLIKAQ